MISLTTKQGLFRTSKGPISARVHVIHPSVVIVGSVLSGSSGMSPGQILIRNRALKKRSKNEAEWMRYVDVYSALRGMVHATRDGGAQPNVRDGEMQEFVVLPDVLRRCSRLLFSSATFDHFLEEASQEGIEYVVATLQHRHVDALVSAYLDTLRGIQQKDSRGRKNAPAAAMALGGAIQQMNKREQGLRLIMKFLNGRVYRMTEVIYSVIDTYELLLEAMGGRKKEDWLSERAIFVRIANRETYQRHAVASVSECLERHIVAFRGMLAFPHVTNAICVRKNLMGMRSHLRILANHWDTESARILQSYIVALRRDILRFLARHELEIEIHAPISWTLGDRARARKIIRKAVHAPSHTEVDTVGSEDELRFAVIRQRMGSFFSRIRDCDEHLLDPVIRQYTLQQMVIAMRCADQGAWSEAESRVESIAHQL